MLFRSPPSPPPTPPPPLPDPCRGPWPRGRVPEALRPHPEGPGPALRDHSLLSGPRCRSEGKEGRESWPCCPYIFANSCYRITGICLAPGLLPSNTLGCTRTELYFAKPSMIWHIIHLAERIRSWRGISSIWQRESVLDEAYHPFGSTKKT